MKHFVLGVLFWTLLGLIAVLVKLSVESPVAGASSVAQLSIEVVGKEMRFRVEPKAGWHVNAEAPWSMTIVPPDGKNVQVTDDSSPGTFLVPRPAPDSSYNLTAYLCDEAKTECKQETFQGRIAL